MKKDNALVNALKRMAGRTLVRRDAWVERVAATVPAGAVVLDIGAGGAPYRGHFKQCKYLTQDAAQLAPDLLRGGKFAQIDMVCDATNIPMGDGSIDYVLCTEVIEHVPQPLEVIREMGRLLKPGGVAFITAPLGSGLHQEPYHYYGGYTPHFYRYAADRAGFEVVSIEANGSSVDHFTQWVWWLIIESRNYARSHPLTGIFCLGLSLLTGLPMIVAAAILSRILQDARFTVGYHVVLKKR